MSLLTLHVIYCFIFLRQFDLRFVIIQDRFDTEKFQVCYLLCHFPFDLPPSLFLSLLSFNPYVSLVPQKRSVEDLKAHYYSVYNRLLKLRDPSVEDSQLISYDAPHETKRKAQLERLFNRTKEQVSHYSVCRVLTRLL